MTTTSSDRKRRKLGLNIESLTDNETVIGTIGEVKTIQTKKFPEPISYVEITTEKGEIRAFWMNGGLKGAFTLAGVKPGMFLEIVHTGKKNVELETGNFDVNTYDIFELT